MMTSMERARSCKQADHPARRRREPRPLHDLPRCRGYTSFAARTSGKLAFEMAGVRHDELDLAMIYDSFTYTVLLSLEELGFCKKGEGGDFVSGQRTAPGGPFPMNTNGGGLSPPRHVRHVRDIEGVRGAPRLRRQGIRQVKDAKLAVVHGTGGVLSSAGTAILARA
ncbi:MAG: hypothetical protein U0841_17325 [Chloroflexia bacterium]